jgi:hypothetical protein
MRRQAHSEVKKGHEVACIVSPFSQLSSALQARLDIEEPATFTFFASFHCVSFNLGEALSVGLRNLPLVASARNGFYRFELLRHTRLTPFSRLLSASPQYTRPVATPEKAAPQPIRARADRETNDSTNAMASGSDRAAVASGADTGDAARRRNIPGTPQQVLVPQPQADEKKKTPKQPSVLQVLEQWEWLIAPIVFTALAFFTRLYKIGLSPIVTWDEAQSVLPTSLTSHKLANMPSSTALESSVATT